MAIQQKLKDPTLRTFPLSQTYKIQVPEFSNIWIKDESTNETGTHKDRMALAILTEYFKILDAKKQGLTNGKLPSFSLISSGSAALAIQNQLHKFGLPNLKVLVDINLNKTLLEKLRNLECEIYQTNLAEKSLTSTEILAITKNSNGFDITSNKGFSPTLHFYDWISYEILNENPDYVFLPFGTGHLYENILDVCKQILTTDKVESVYTGKKENIRTCHFLGATTNDPKSKAEKLYAPFRPFVESHRDFIRLFSIQGLCGDTSGVYEVQENFIEEAYCNLTNQDISVEYSAVAGLALLLQMKDQIPKDKKILIVSTGKAKFPLS